MIPRLKQQTQLSALYLDYLQALQKSGFTGDIHTDYANRTVLSTDNSIYQVLPQAVVYPRNTEDIVSLCVLAQASKFHEIVLCPRGGGTGTNAQSLTDGLVVDISKYMHKILEINGAEGWVRVQSGVVKDQLNAALKPHGLFFAPELSTSNRATIGGMINTDASGQGSCLYGKTRDHVIELQTVLMDGSILCSRAMDDSELKATIDHNDRSALVHRIVENIHQEFDDLIQDTFPKLNRCLTGYDLAHIRDANKQFNLNNILCGSEGTLGFITEAKLNVLPIPKYTALMVVTYREFQDSLRDASDLMQANPSSIETIDSKVLNLAMQDFIWHQVVELIPDNDGEVKGINLLEFTADSEQALASSIAELELILNNFGGDVERLDYRLASGQDAVNRIWSMRKRAVGLLGNVEGEARPIPFVEDTAVPPEHLADFIAEFREILDAYKLDYGMFGHVDAGVLHVRPALDMKVPHQENIAWEISDRIAELTLQYRGLLWGEHGKGVRSEYSPKFFGPLYPQLQRIKSAFDPYNQLNPGKIATPDSEIKLLKIDEVPTRGQQDRTVLADNWQAFNDAVYCNGNGACFNWNPQDAMCPSWKGTRQRVNSPKGRASLIREWLRQLSARNKNVSNTKIQGSLLLGPVRMFNSILKKCGQQDFSHEVYNSMAACLACKSCAGQCPIKVDVPEFRSKFLAFYHTRYSRPLKDHLVGSLEFVLPLAAKFPKSYNSLMKKNWVRYFLERVAGFVDGPQLSGITLDKSYFQIARPKALLKMPTEQRKKIVIIVQDAFTTYFETPLVQDVFKLIATLGFTPMLAPYKANGKPLHVHGFLRAFQRRAKQNARMLNGLSSTGATLVGIDPSMTLTYRGEYKKYLEGEKPPEVLLLQEWLAKNLSALRDIETFEEPINYRLLPHCTEASNAADTLKGWQQAFEATGHRLIIENTGCCGMSGTFGHEARNKKTADKIYALSWRPQMQKDDSPAHLMASGYSCRSQVKRMDNIPLRHPAQVLLSILSQGTIPHCKSLTTSASNAR